MQVYQINELERLTGIKAHTIRIWEKRYHLITPARTDTNRRYYNDAQVRKLLNVTTLLSQGHKISKVASYTETELNDYILNAASDVTNDDGYMVYVNDLLKNMLAFDQLGFERLFSKALRQYGVHRTMIHIIYPFLNKTGILWSVNQAAPVQEHFASCIIRRKLIALTDALPAAQPAKKRFLLFLPPGEWHEIGLLFANYTIRAKGHETIYLGQNVPVEDVGEIAKTMLPSHILAFYIAARPEGEILVQLKEVLAAGKDMQFLVAGSKEILPAKKTSLKNLTYLHDVKALADFL